MVEIDWENNACIICGMHNPNGLRLHFDWVDGKMQAFPTIGPGWQGFEGLVHGGIITGMLDDAMWHAIYREQHATTLTASINVRFVRPVRVAVPLVVQGWVLSAHSRLMRAQAEIREKDGLGLLASAEGRFLTPSKSEKNL